MVDLLSYSYVDNNFVQFHNNCFLEMKSVIFSLVCICVVYSELAYVAELFRHGARYTNHKFYDYNDTWQDEG